MIKRALFAVLVFAAPFCPVSAQDAKVPLNYVAAASDQTEAKIDMAATGPKSQNMRSANVADISQRRVDHLSPV
jgi:hypothetical protein